LLFNVFELTAFAESSLETDCSLSDPDELDEFEDWFRLDDEFELSLSSDECIDSEPD